MQLRHVTLEDKYLADKSTVLMSGTQALVRLPLLQKALDKAHGLNTGGYISGYRGSPIGGYDQALWQIQSLLKENNIVFEPGVNEDIAATAVWGTQQLAETPDVTVDGVFAIWYGKAPGVDRSCDPLKHGNFGGSHPNGGVLVVAGDDHGGKSSTLAAQSERAFMHCGIPILAPANVQDCLDFGAAGFAMSRYTGLYTGFKATNETLELTATVDVDLERYNFNYPDKGELPNEGVHFVSTHIDRLRSDVVVNRYRMPLVHKFVRANNLNRVLQDSLDRRLGIVTAGKATQDVLQALTKLGIDDQRAAELGISVYQVGCVWPLEPEGLVEFAAGQEELLFVEEKRAIIEPQATSILYNRADAPRITGKRNEEDKFLLAEDIQLTQSDIALAIFQRLQRLSMVDGALASKAGEIHAERAYSEQNAVAPIARSPFFCSGCPHNSSLKKPEGSYTAGGIGCHSMALYHHDYMMPNTHMGGEGGQWIGLAHFTKLPHIFQNMGDGTYYHSGLLAIRAAAASGQNITYKILFNDAVAMTGGQPVEGNLSVGEISHQVLAEGAKECVVVSDRPELYGADSGLAQGVQVHHRDELMEIQDRLRKVEGLTVLIYEQTCAAEKRRRRKRGKFPDPAKRMFINPEVCEGCGDCSVQSNCVSLVPLETELGRKRAVDQSTCNKDYSCTKGFCPSFVTVLGGEPRKPEKVELSTGLFADLPEPAHPDIIDSYGVMISGIGGTGVVTVGAVLAMAAHLEYKQSSVFDMTGLSQKNGAVYSHLRIANSRDKIGSQRLGAGEADLVLAFDMVAAQSTEPQLTINRHKSKIVANTRVLPTAGFQKDPDMQFNSRELLERFINMVGGDAVFPLDASDLGRSLCGDSIAANMMLVGYATQLGLLPLSVAAIERAIEINGVAVKFNLEAFNLGRLCVHAPQQIETLLGGGAATPAAETRSLENIVAYRHELLSNYQDTAYAERYASLVATVVAAEAAFPDKDLALAKAVARNAAKLMAYKDEYEVARLYSSPEFIRQLKQTFQGEMTLKFNLAPPLLSKTDRYSGLPIKREYGSWMLGAFRLLAKLKFLRGTALDIFGYTAERKLERQLIDDYFASIDKLLSSLDSATYDTAVAIASLPEGIRGFGHVKERHLETVRREEKRLWATFNNGGIDPARADLIAVDAVEVYKP
ncbi:indolepyruvate ferredoxin oxidoreductase family protein [Spongiibacter sp. KMU-166]|uniref:Indolepyruvate ferredoxin oxidoreductase family protein n=1 Tax=Spongiibacter thalassae TaxID=2721624 RepID=A0ABX1GBP3_9GAMM|nr:indolepyruvate ferredoxin oxidoreductase family protein [Spongiibacter thalassae]NKI16580.1 indolepyruvate ferredoxin oxidoreductase family protein [Spongiibacter thalassae]